MKLLIHLLGFIIISIGLSLGNIFYYDLSFWIVLFGVSVVYINA